jgi:hypothetical protein
MKTVNLDRKFAAAIVALILISTAIGALLVQQYFPQIGSIKAEGMEDPLEAWSEASYIIWQYNTTFYASRNMSTWDTELDSNKTYIEQMAIGNLTVSGGSIYLKQVTLNTSLTYGANILIIEDYQGIVTYYRDGRKITLNEPASEASYVVGRYNSTFYYMKNGTTGNYDFLSTNASKAFNFAFGNMTSGGKVFYKNGTYTLDSSIIMSSNDQVLEGESWGAILSASGTNYPVITIGADGSTLYRIGLRNVHIDCASGSSQIIGILQYRCTASVFENIYITGSSSASRLQYGWVIDQTAAGAHSWDNFMSNIRILNFYTDGLVAEDLEDTAIINMNIGTQRAGANACLKWETPNTGTDAGGSGVFVTNFHWWGVAGNTVYGIYLSGVYDGVFRVKWVNIWGGDCQNGIYFESGDACYHSFSNINVGTCSVARITNNGVGNRFENLRYGNAACELFFSNTTAADGGIQTFTLGSTPTFISVTSGNITINVICGVGTVTATSFIYNLEDDASAGVTGQTVYVHIRFDP